MQTSKSAEALLDAFSGSARTIEARAPIERMVRIYGALRDKRPVNANIMASELEVSTRSIGRDIEFMRDRLQLPIEYDEVKHSYYFAGGAK